MVDARETARRLLELALHEGTPEHERNAAAMGFCRAARKLGLVGDAGPRVVTQRDVNEAVRAAVRQRAPDQIMGSGVVRVGEAQYCRACVLRPRMKKQKPKPSVIPRGTVAVKVADGYVHPECAEEWRGR